MYGIVIEGVRYFIQCDYGEELCQHVMKNAHLETAAFNSHSLYSEKVIPNILVSLSEMTGENIEQIGRQSGRYFVHYMIKNGYGPLLRIIGRTFSEFLGNLDNLHEYFRISYPKINPPSFFCSMETNSGMIMYYRSQRRGYTNYMIGQLLEIARIMFQMDITVTVLKSELRDITEYVTLGIRYNHVIGQIQAPNKNCSDLVTGDALLVNSHEFLKLFPFFIVCTMDLEIRLAGEALSQMLPNIIGSRMSDSFELIKPSVKYTGVGLSAHLNNMFKFRSRMPVVDHQEQSSIVLSVNNVVDDNVQIKSLQDIKSSYGTNLLQLNGPIVFLKDQQFLLYLPTVLVDSFDEMHSLGLYLQDYSNSDVYREIMMTRFQKTDDVQELLNIVGVFCKLVMTICLWKHPIEQEKQKSWEITAMMHEVKDTRQRAQDLLISMLPRRIADDLLASGTVHTVCEAFDSVTLAFIKVSDFLQMTVELDVVDIVVLLNTLFSKFDQIMLIHGAYKVETVGESYLFASGVPDRNEHHSEVVADTAIDVIAGVQEVQQSDIRGTENIDVRIGMHSGAIVGAVVGKRAPRYCLFGDTINTASRMQSHNALPMSIQCGDAARQSLEHQARGQFVFKHRGTVNLKGKGETEVYTLVRKDGPPRYLVANDEDSRIHDELAEQYRYTPVRDEDDHDSTVNDSSSLSNVCCCSEINQMVDGITEDEFRQPDFGLKGLTLLLTPVAGSDYPFLENGQTVAELIEKSDLQAQAAIDLKNKRKTKRKRKKFIAGEPNEDSVEPNRLSLDLEKLEMIEEEPMLIGQSSIVSNDDEFDSNHELRRLIDHRPCTKQPTKEYENMVSNANGSEQSADINRGSLAERLDAMTVSERNPANHHSNTGASVQQRLNPLRSLVEESKLRHDAHDLLAAQKTSDREEMKPPLPPIGNGVEVDSSKRTPLKGCLN